MAWHSGRATWTSGLKVLRSATFASPSCMAQTSRSLDSVAPHAKRSFTPLALWVENICVEHNIFSPFPVYFILLSMRHSFLHFPSLLSTLLQFLAQFTVSFCKPFFPQYHFITHHFSMSLFSSPILSILFLVLFHCFIQGDPLFSITFLSALSPFPAQSVTSFSEHLCSLIPFIPIQSLCCSCSLPPPLLIWGAAVLWVRETVVVSNMDVI